MSDQEPQRRDDDRAEPAAEPATTTSVIQAVSRRNWTRGLILLAISMVVLVALGFASARIKDQLDRSPAQVALDEIEAAPDALSATTELSSGGTATVEWSESLGIAVFHSQDLPDLADDEQFALWFTRGKSSTPAGVFVATGHDALVQLEGPIGEGDVVTLTVEPGGDAPAEPSGDELVSIPTS